MPTDPSLEGLEDLVPDDLPAEDTPDNEVTTEAPVEDTPTATEADDAYKGRYDNLRSEFDRRNQRYQQELEEKEAELAKYREQFQTPAPRDEYEYEDDELGYDPLQDPRVQSYLSKVDTLEERLAAREQALEAQAQQERDHGFIDNELDRLEKATGTELSDQASEWIGREALANRDPVTGEPDVEGAHEAFLGMFEDLKKAWVSKKRSAGKPAAGAGAVEVPDLDDPDKLEDYLDEAFNAHFGS
jgi:hypothetical protein